MNGFTDSCRKQHLIGIRGDGHPPTTVRTGPYTAVRVGYVKPLLKQWRKPERFEVRIGALPRGPSPVQRLSQACLLSSVPADQLIGTRLVFSEKLTQRGRISDLNGCLYIHASFICRRAQRTRPASPPTPEWSPPERALSPEPPDSLDKALVRDSPPKRRRTGYTAT
jgi:hypothetical protein